MPNFDLWLTTDYLEVMSAETRAALAWRRIMDRPSSVVLTRNRVQLAAQTFRIESDNTATDHINMATNVITALQKVTLFGVRDHASEPDSDIQRSDRFTINGTVFEVQALMTPPGEVQAICEVTRAT